MTDVCSHALNKSHVKVVLMKLNTVCLVCCVYTPLSRIWRAGKSSAFRSVSVACCLATWWWSLSPGWKSKTFYHLPFEVFALFTFFAVLFAATAGNCFLNDKIWQIHSSVQVLQCELCRQRYLGGYFAIYSVLCAVNWQHNGRHDIFFLFKLWCVLMGSVTVQPKKTSICPMCITQGYHPRFSPSSGREISVCLWGEK